MTDKPHQLHQMLHGYSEGHRLLGASLSLPPKDAKALLQLSDASSSGMRVDDDAYLTGYPLADSGYYALAKTWPAAEMPRPGCVWTHTILIPLSDIGLIDDLGTITELFKRPGSRILGYDVPLTVDLSRKCEIEIDIVCARAVFSGVYGKPASKIVHDRPTRGGDGIVLALWSQQWPSLRANFRFCTSTSSDRGIPGHEFDLQFITGGQASRNRFPKSIIATDVTAFNDTAWHRHGFKDLLKPDVEGFRTLSRSIDDDQQFGRRAFAHLAQFNLFLRDNTSAASTKNAVQFLRENLKAVKSRDVRIKVSNRIVDQIQLLDDEALSYLMEDLSVLEGRDTGDFARVGARVLMTSAPRFWDLDTDVTGKAIIRHTIESMNDETLLATMVAAPGRTLEMIELRPEIVALPSFWRHTTFGGRELMAAIARDSALKSAAGNAILDAGRDDLASDVFEAVGKSQIFDLVWDRVRSGGVDRALRPWFDMICKDRPSIAKCLSRGAGVSPAVLAEIAGLIPPDDVPNSVGTDPWLIATRGITWMGADRRMTFLASYLFSRALGPTSRDAGELAASVLPFLHDAAAKAWIDDDIWSSLQKRLPKSLFGWDWDRCWRLRAAFVDLVVSGQPASALANLRADGQLFMAIAHWAMRSSRGRDYLWRVGSELKGAGNANLASSLYKLLRD